MYNSDYIPLDQVVIDQEVERMAENRKKAKAFLRNASRNAGGNFDIIVFRNARNKRIIAEALEDLRLFWCEVDGEIYTNRHFFYDVVLDRE